MTMLNLALGAPQPTILDLSIKSWLDEQIALKRTGYATYDRYYRGQHEVKLTDRLKKLFSTSLQFRDNFCEVVVDVMAERLNIIGFQADSENVAEWAWDLWQANRMDYIQHIVHTEAIAEGDSYILVDWDMEQKRPRFTFQDPELILPHYNPETHLMDWASKSWTWIPEAGAKPLTRMNLFFPDRIEKYRSEGNVWIKHLDDGETEWPLAWVGKDGRPLGIPIVHFRNKAGSNDFGLSELENVIPLQDLLNKSLVDLTMVLDLQAFPQRYTVGIKSPAQFEVTPGAVWALQPETGEAEKTKIGEFPPADVAGILAGIEMLVQHLSGRSRTPQHLFHLSGGFPSGESLKVAESGLVHKVQMRQVAFGNAWEDCMALAQRLQNTFGTAISEELVEALWDDAETRNEREHLESLKLKTDLGISKRQVWRELGYTSQEIEQIEEDLEAEKVADANIGEAILKEFEKGSNA